MERRPQEGGSLKRIALLLLAAAGARADDCRFVLADQSDWEGKLGFYVQLENAGAPCRSGTMTLDMGVADGQMWRFFIETPAWQLNHDYTVKAVVSSGLNELYLDGKLLASSTGDSAPFLPSASTPLTSGLIPGWASGATDYLVTQTGLTITSSGGPSAAFDFSDSKRPVPLMLLAPGTPKSTPWTASAADAWTVTATFHLAAYPDTASFVPYIDRYGQSRHADWQGKILSDSDLTASAAAESAKLQEWGLRIRAATVVEQSDPQVRLGRGIGRIERQRFPIIGRGGVRIAGLRQRNGELDEPHRVASVERVRPAVLFHRLALLAVRQSAPKPGRNAPWHRPGQFAGLCGTLVWLRPSGFSA